MFEWNLRGKLVSIFLIGCIVPLVITMVYVGHRAKIMIEEESMDYMKTRVDSFARMTQTRYEAISGNIDTILEQLKLNLMKDLTASAAKERYFKTGYLILFQSNGFCLYHPRQEFTGSTALYDKYPFIREAIRHRGGFSRYDLQGVHTLAYLDYNRDLDIVMLGVVPEGEIFAKVHDLNTQMYSFLAVVSLLIIICGGYVAQRMANTVRSVSTTMQDIAVGEGDLTVRLPVNSADEIGSLATWFNRFIENLEEVIRQVKYATDQVSASSREVSSGAEGLSRTSEKQASAVRQVSSTMEDMTSSIKQNASHAQSSREKVKAMVEMADRTDSNTRELIMAMNEMSAVSKKISEVTGTVNEVAFQTNLLALNAAVEAARAGVQGSGFAVVAQEVRNLAIRSGAAAQEIKALIEDAVGKIAASDTMVRRTNETMQAIITGIAELSQAMDQITASSSQQASGVDEINASLAQIDSSTRENAFTVGELAHTADAMNVEADKLSDIVQRFLVSE
jgi:methyl-accepting chemotaxis protein